MILLTGITGNIGGATARALVARGVKFRALVRDTVKAAAWVEHGVELVQADLEDATSVKRALVSVNCALLVLPNSESQERLETSFVRTAKESGLSWIIKLSSPEAIRGTESPIPLAHIAAEDAIMASGMKWTLVRPSFYMQNFRSSLKTARTTGKLSMPMGLGTVALTDNQDAGAFIAHLLTDPHAAQHHDRCYDITGPDPVMNFHDIAKVIGEVVGQPITYDDCDAKAFQETIRPFHRNQWHSDAVAHLFAEIADGRTPGRKTDTFQKIMGQPGRSLREYLQSLT
ncbi:MAG: NAD-dependent epimerase/dehydratase family protein [Gammaproteobacteria bacterium]|nr:NAD-dependent epimerase/dehydratase family protein [Gammaproteobacteria bacterium]MBM4234017.1 NAD-dependent epimerase/dehydratase family protein [Gammaproteobacteria bacterium]